MADRGIPLPVLLDASARLWLRLALLLGLGLAFRLWPISGGVGARFSRSLSRSPFFRVPVCLCRRAKEEAGRPVLPGRAALRGPEFRCRCGSRVHVHCLAPGNTGMPASIREYCVAMLCLGLAGAGLAALPGRAV